MMTPLGYFDYLETRDENGLITRIYTPVKKQEEGSFSLEVFLYLFTFCTVSELVVFKVRNYFNIYIRITHLAVTTSILYIIICFS